MISARQALLDGALHGPTTVLHDGPVITAIRPWAPGDPEPLDGVLIPGAVNAHLHLELSWAAGRVPGGQGFDGWLRGLLALSPPEDAFAMARAQARAMADAGTVAVSDICNGPDTSGLFAEVGIGGVVQHELFTLDRGRLPALLDAAAIAPARTGGIVRRASPHAVYSTAPALIQATVAADGLGHPASIHVAEDPAEADLLRDGSGTFPARLDALGLDWRWWTPPGCSPIAYLDQLGVLGPALLLVHGVWLDDDDRTRIARSGASLCLCPRSNLHIGGRLPDVPALLRAGVPLCLGTDSLASAPDLDVLHEIRPLQQAFPEVPLSVWLTLATAGGSDALGLPHAGRLRPGCAPGVLLFDGHGARVLLPANAPVLTGPESPRQADRGYPARDERMPKGGRRPQAGAPTGDDRWNRG